MTLQKVLFAIYTFFLIHLSFAQMDGDLLDETRINGFEELIEYIKKTEKRDTVDLDISRFKYFEDVKVFGITYSSDSFKVKGFLLIPEGKGNYPAIVYNRGGSKEWGSLTHFAASVGLGELAEIVKEGYVVVASQYRGNGGSEGQEEYGGRDIHDVLNLINLLGTIPEADTSRIGMFGWSRGGATTFITLKKTNRIKTVVVGGPGADLLAVAEDRPELGENWATFIPNYQENKQQVLKDRSVMYWVDQLPRDVPILLLHGNADRKVKPRSTLLLALEFDKYKIPYRLIMFEGGNHAIREHHEEVFRQIILWFERFLKKGEDVPITTVDKN